jgi:hypothetical protein
MLVSAPLPQQMLVSARLPQQMLVSARLPQQMLVSAQEGIAVLEAARYTVDGVAGTCQLIEIVLEWFQTKEPHLLPTAIDHLDELLVIYQKGSLLHGSAQVLLTLCRHSA